MPPLRIGTRGSQLALWQARSVATRLEAAGARVDLVVIRTAGDRLQEAPLSEIGGKRLFVKELEDALRRGEIDLAVHSAKDLPAILPEGLALAATLPRDDPRDAIVLPSGKPGGGMDAVLAQLPQTPRIGTSSVRRIAQLRRRMPGAVFTPIRGNVDTRLRKLDSGDYDALVLAAAGMRRLGVGERISAAVPAGECVPAPGQGIIAVETTAGNGRVVAALQPVHHEATWAALEAERAVVAALGGGCQLPLGAFAAVRGNELDLQAVVCSEDGARVVTARGSGPMAAPLELGRRVAEELAAGGAGRILDDVREAQRPVEGSY